VRLRRLGEALRRRDNWGQLVKFCAVGASGYVVNLLVYLVLLEAVGLDFRLAAIGSFLVAVTNNYVLNRAWTFRDERGRVWGQAWRFFVVSVATLVANLVVLQALVSAGIGEFVAQAAAIVVVTPVSFIGNKIWSFRRPGPPIG
jgi:putative flippase GtrA